jgi:hypothetical protein
MVFIEAKKKKKVYTHIYNDPLTYNNAVRDVTSIIYYTLTK